MPQAQQWWPVEQALVGINQREQGEARARATLQSREISTQQQCLPPPTGASSPPAARYIMTTSPPLPCSPCVQMEQASASLRRLRRCRQRQSSQQPQQPGAARRTSARASSGCCTGVGSSGGRRCAVAHGGLAALLVRRGRGRPATHSGRVQCRDLSAADAAAAGSGPSDTRRLCSVPHSTL